MQLNVDCVGSSHVCLVIELSRLFVDTRRNLQVEPPQDPQPSDEHELNIIIDESDEDNNIDEVEGWIEQAMLDNGDEDHFEVEDDDEFNPAEIVCDPAHRQQIDDYHPNMQDQVRRAYLLKGPTQLTNKFGNKKGSKNWAFSKDWFKKYDWIEYSESEQIAFYF